MSIDANNRLLPAWFMRIQEHQLALPRFQRFEAWGHSQVTLLFNSILQGLPVGSLLVLEVGDDELFISRPIEGAPLAGGRVAEHLLDGQQRLTALWRGLHNDYPDRTYFLFEKQDEETGFPRYVDSIARWKNEGDTERRPFWANQPKEQWSRHMIPLDLLSPESASPFFKWLSEATDVTEEREQLTQLVFTLREHFAKFNLPYLSLPVVTKKETALDVFLRMNTSASPLSMYDIVVAQVEAGMGKSLHDLVATIREVCPGIADYYDPESLAIYVGALLQNRAPTNATYMQKDFGTRMLDNWDIFINGVSRTVEFLEQERIFDAARLPTDVVVPMLVALWGLAPRGLDAEGRAHVVLRKYLWRAFFSNRYERSTGSRSLVDFNELRPIVTGAGSTSPSIFDDAQHPLPRPQELAAAGWPVRKDRLARAILALALRNGGIDLADGGAATRSNLAKREYHHLFPVAHLARQHVPDNQVFLSLNCALVTWRTNRTISDKEPERYLAERLDGTDITESEVRDRLASHLIPYDEMKGNRYPAFLDKRASMVHEAMTKLCTGAAL